MIDYFLEQIKFNFMIFKFLTMIFLCLSLNILKIKFDFRIQIFDKEGRFKFQFGECGKRDGQLLYPNRVAVVKSSGDIIVTERSPTHHVCILFWIMHPTT